MDENALSKITELLNSPDIMNNVQSVISQLTQSNDDSKAIIPASTDMASATSLLSNSSFISSIANMLSQNKSERIALLSALKPFLSSDKQSTVDTILQLLKTASLFLSMQTLK